MSAFWFILGLLIGGAAVAVWTQKRSSYQWSDWLLIAVGLILWILTLGFISSVLQEPYVGAGRAAGIGGMLLGIVALVYSVIIYRFKLEKN